MYLWLETKLKDNLAIVLRRAAECSPSQETLRHEKSIDYDSQIQKLQDELFHARNKFEDSQLQLTNSRSSLITLEEQLEYLRNELSLTLEQAQSNRELGFHEASSAYREQIISLEDQLRARDQELSKSLATKSVVIKFLSEILSCLELNVALKSIITTTGDFAISTQELNSLLESVIQTIRCNQAAAIHAETKFSDKCTSVDDICEIGSDDFESPFQVEPQDPSQGEIILMMNEDYSSLRYSIAQKEKMIRVIFGKEREEIVAQYTNQLDQLSDRHSKEIALITRKYNDDVKHQRSLHAKFRETVAGLPIKEEEKEEWKKKQQQN